MDGAFAGNEVFFCLTKLQRMERFFLRSNSKVVMVLFFSKKKTSRKQKAFPFEVGKGGVGHWSSQGTVQTAAARGSRARGTGSSGPLGWASLKGERAICKVTAARSSRSAEEQAAAVPLQRWLL